MFVRWKRQKREGLSKTSLRRSNDWGDSLRGCLVENTRSGGKVRQRVICYLGAVDEKLKTRSHIQAHFWRHADPRLDELNLSADQRTKVEAMITRTVPRSENQT
jgi:hypothetical protein